MTTLNTTVPASVLTPDSFHTFQHVKAGAGLAALPLRVLLVGTKSTAGTATTETPVQLFDVADAKGEAQIQPHGVPDRVWREPVPLE